MKQIRFGTFETNSSSTHSLVMCTQDEYKAWDRGEVYYVEWLTSEMRNKLGTEYIGKTFIPTEVADAVLQELGIDEEERSEYFKTSDEFFENEYLETFEETYTTPGGETVIAFGVFGYDG